MKTTPTLTEAELTELRKLLANKDTLAGSHELSSAAVAALPDLLDAAEREQKLMEALELIDDAYLPHECTIGEGSCDYCMVKTVARAALTEGGN